MKGIKVSGPWEVVLVAAVCICAFFVNNQVITPDIMESRNIIAAREMVYDGHWITPTMNGDLRLEKPPLPTWLTAVAEIASPDNVALQRAMAGLAALLLVFYFWRFARKVLDIDPLVPTLLLVTCYNVILMGRTASWDIYCHAFMMGGIYYLARGLCGKSRQWGNFIASGVFIGLSIMSKGPVSLYALFLPFLLSYPFFYRHPMRGKTWPLVTMILLALAIGTWWFIYIHLTQTEALEAVALKESSSWINHNVRPWWYYWQFFLESGAWSLLLLTAMFLPLFNPRRRTSRRWLFPMCWMLASLVLLSLLPEKKTRYLLPLLIPAGYVMGVMILWWKQAFSHAKTAAKSDRVMFRINTYLMAAVVAVVPVAAWMFLLQPGYISMTVWILFAIIAVAIAVYLVMAAVKLRPMHLLYGVTALFAAAECFALPMLGNVINNPDMKSIRATRTVKALEGIPFYHVDTVPLRIELVYAAHRNIRPVSPDSLRAKLPCALLTHRPISETLPQNKLQGIEAIQIDSYDDNRRPKTNKRYGTHFIYYVTLLRDSAGAGRH